MIIGKSHDSVYRARRTGWPLTVEVVKMRRLLPPRRGRHPLSRVDNAIRMRDKLKRMRPRWTNKEIWRYLAARGPLRWVKYSAFRCRAVNRTFLSLDFKEKGCKIRSRKSRYNFQTEKTFA